MQPIPLSRCFVNAEIKAAVIRALESGRYILEEECAAFEAELAAYTGARHAVLGSSWTMLVYLLHLAQGLSRGAEIIVPSLTAFPTIEPLLHCGARPVFVDVDDTFCLDVDQVEAAITPRTVGIIPVHLYGHPARMDRLLDVARRHGVWVLEDCAQALGARFREQPVGTFGNWAAFSFFPSKNLTVLGDGGCLVTNDGAMADEIRALRNHGRKSKYIHDRPGFNVRFNAIQAAVGRVALNHLDRLNQRRREIAHYYAERLPEPVIKPRERDGAVPVYHMYVVRVPQRDPLQRYLQQHGIETGIHYPVPNHQQPAVTDVFGPLPPLPRTEQWTREILSLPIHGEMPLEHAARVCEVVEAFYRGTLSFG